jgi:hypothetical protein
MSEKSEPWVDPWEDKTLPLPGLMPITIEPDWHAQRDPSEPRCGANQWRTRDRMVVMDMTDMEDRHLGHCIRFASTKPQHASRLAGLLAERQRRAAGTART